MKQNLNPRGRNLRDATILKRYTSEPYPTMQVLGDEYGMTREGIRKIINKQLKKSANSRGAEKIK